MPVLALSGSSTDATLATPLPLHLSPWAAAALESLLGGRSGRLTADHLPALDALVQRRPTDADLRELLGVLRRDGEASVSFL